MRSLLAAVAVAAAVRAAVATPDAALVETHNALELWDALFSGFEHPEEGLARGRAMQEVATVTFSSNTIAHRGAVKVTATGAYAFVV
jgi:hypothetical protein